MKRAIAGTVYLVGAGPGDPELLTLKAARLLAEADVVLHDDLVPPAILDCAGKQTLLMSVGKRCGKKKITQAAIHETMVSSARRGLVVVRLKAGDPLVFGRAGEEIDALRAAQIPFEVVPGVTAAFSAAAELGASLTDRRVASKLIVLSGHHAAGELPEPIFGEFAIPDDATLAIYMPGSDLARIGAALLDGGLAPDTPCIVVSDASRPTAGFAAFRLREMKDLAPSPSARLLLAGRVFESVLERAMLRERDLAQSMPKRNAPDCPTVPEQRTILERDSILERRTILEQVASIVDVINE